MRGRWLTLSAPRRFLADMLRFADCIPTVPVQRRMNLTAVRQAREAAANRPGWPALFIKAYARVAATMPELRRAYITLPWAHLCEYPVSVATVAVEREYEDEKAVFFGRIVNPAELPLPDLHSRVQNLAEAPIEEIKPFRKMLWMGRLPGPIRRTLLWLGLNMSRTRGNQFGTFGLTVYSSLGAESLHPISPLTVTMTYGVIAPDGSVDVRIVYDHRTLDGATIARALSRLEEELTGAIRDELLALPSVTECRSTACA